MVMVRGMEARKKSKLAKLTSTHKYKTLEPSMTNFCQLAAWYDVYIAYFAIVAYIVACILSHMISIVQSTLILG